MLDANFILRFLLRDIEEQFREAKNIVRNEHCFVTLEILAEVSYVLEGVYQVSRVDIIRNFRELSKVVLIQNADVLLRALEIFDKLPKLDFVDCLLYGYKMERGMEIKTFDRKLKKKLEEVEILGW